MQNIHDVPTPGSSPLSTFNMCCGGKKCPQIADFGDRVVVCDNGVSVEFSRAQASELRAWLVARGY
jgi:hypothetical protein